MDDAGPEPLDHRVFANRTLSGSRFIGCDLSAVVVRGSEVAGMEWEHHRYAVRDLDALDAGGQWAEGRESPAAGREIPAVQPRPS